MNAPTVTTGSGGEACAKCGVLGQLIGREMHFEHSRKCSERETTAGEFVTVGEFCVRAIGPRVELVHETADFLGRMSAGEALALAAALKSAGIDAQRRRGA